MAEFIRTLEGKDSREMYKEVREAGVVEDNLTPVEKCCSEAFDRIREIYREIEGRIPNCKPWKVVAGVTIYPFYGGKGGELGFMFENPSESMEESLTLHAQPYYDFDEGVASGFPFMISSGEDFENLGTFPCHSFTDPKKAADLYFTVVERVLEAMIKAFGVKG